MFLGKSEGTAGPEINKIRTPEKKPVESKQVGLPCSLSIVPFFLDAVLLIFLRREAVHLFLTSSYLYFSIIRRVTVELVTFLQEGKII